MAAFAKAHPHDPVDVIISDYMSEANMVTDAARKVNSSRKAETPADPWTPVGPAFETVFLEALEPALEDLAKYNIKVAANAGASDVEGLYEEVLKMIKKKGLDMKVAWISGDEVWPAVQSALKSGTSKFKNIYTGETLDTWKFKPMYAQAYLGGLGIAEAFNQGAQIVICGRVSDASPVIGSAYWFHQWQRSQLTELANAFVAGHLLECSTYVTGGNYSGFKELENSPGGWTDLGFPIGEISSDGSVVMTKQKNSRGAVTVNTCSSQLWVPPSTLWWLLILPGCTRYKVPGTTTAM
jgi:Acyclic terpene utilisation family protein AtuA